VSDGFNRNVHRAIMYDSLMAGSVLSVQVINYAVTYITCR